MIREVDKAKLTEAKKATAAFKAEKRGTATLTAEEEAAAKYRRIQEARKRKESSASASGVRKVVTKGLEDLTEDQRAHLFRTELSSERAAGEKEWEKELARREKEEEDRRKAQALYRSERRAQALEHGREIQRQRQEEFLKWRAEEEDRENLSKARRISLEPTAEPPASGGVVLTPAPTAASVSPITIENPATPPEALQAPVSEEEIAYRKDLQERLSKFSDEKEDAK